MELNDNELEVIMEGLNLLHEDELRGGSCAFADFNIDFDELHIKINNEKHY